MGFTVVPFGHGFKDMSPPTKELMKLVLEKRIAHGGHPVISWMMDNIFIRTDPVGNIKPDKEKSTEKIDGALALVMALDRAIRNRMVPETVSVYDEREIFFILRLNLSSYFIELSFHCAILNAEGKNYGIFFTG